MRLTEQVLVRERRVVTKAHTVERDKGSKHTPVVVDVVGGQEVDVLCRPHETVGDHREPANHDKAGILCDHRGDGYVEFRVQRGHWLARRLAAATRLGLRGVVRA
jgi:hypothetical protein